MKNTRKKSSNKNIPAIITLTLGIFILLCFLTCNAYKPTFNEEDYIIEEYYIESGDTLWAIAKRNATAGTDLREYIDAVEKLNNITSTIYAGDVIEIYVQK